MFNRKRIDALELRVTRLEDINQKNIEDDHARAVDRQVRWENECMKHSCHDQLPNCPPRCEYVAARPPRWFL